MGKLSRTWELMGMSWQVLKKDKETLVFPLSRGPGGQGSGVRSPAPRPQAPGAQSPAVAFLVLLALVQSALQSIFQAALYLYAKDGQVAEGFSREVLSGAMREK